MTSSKLLNFAKLQFQRSQELWALLSKSGVREEKGNGWLGICQSDSYFSTGCQGTVKSRFLLQEVDSIGQKLALLLHVFNFKYIFIFSLSPEEIWGGLYKDTIPQNENKGTKTKMEREQWVIDHFSNLCACEQILPRWITLAQNP